MKKTHQTPTATLLILPLSLSCLALTSCKENSLQQTTVLPMPQPRDLLIDDFARQNDTPPAARQWQFISDQVMGGRSTGAIDIVQWDNRPCLRMTGSLSLENRGGFIQARTKLNPKAKYFDARPFTGVQAVVKGNNEAYAIHLRTKHTWLPWQYYQATFGTDGTWQTIKLPFDTFQPFSLANTLDTATLKTIAIVAIKKEFDADILVDQLSFYTAPDNP